MAPVDTGNLRQSVSLRFYEGASVIWVDLAKAPYMPYTNEPWVSPFWNGKQNPNQYWFDDAVEDVIKQICRQYGGTAERVFSGQFVDFNQLAQDYRIEPYQILMHSDFKTHTFGRKSDWHY
jgi:hypothetical protein